MKRFMAMAALLIAAAGSVAATDAPAWSWQQPQAKVLATGDLEWAPTPFVFEAVGSVRYIDFASGDDASDGLSKQTPWKHHPWDANAVGRARQSSPADAYVFKRGVVYRGRLAGKCAGTPDKPVALTSDPSWGEGEAVLVGSEAVTGWQPAAAVAPPGLPEPGKVWYADVPFFPRNLWAAAPDGAVTRLKLARTPNWTESNPDDVMSEWWTWENPGWWQGKDKVAGPGGKPMHLGTDTKHLTREPDYYKGASLWTEFGIVMGTPYSTPVEGVEPEGKALLFQGVFFGDSQMVMAGCRYYLEDTPQYLDEAGEFWAAPSGKGARLFVRMPGDTDPSGWHIEAAERNCIVDMTGAGNLRVCGLTFAFTNVFRDLGARQFDNPEQVQAAAVRLTGTAGALRVDHCRFHDVNMAVRVWAAGGADRVGEVIVSDSDVADTDYGAVEVADNSLWGKYDPPFSRIGDVQVLRNRMERIGQRPYRADSAPAVKISFPETCTVAGNILHRCYGQGIWVFGGKRTAEFRDVGLTRILIFQNKIVDALLRANDWGALATWQGGPCYVFDNIVANPRGIWNWQWQSKTPEQRRTTLSGCGYSFYLDGGFKNYIFNNITWGKPGNSDTYAWTSFAFFQVMGIQNQFFNNTAYELAGMSQRQEANGGRSLILGNLFIDFPLWGFQHAKSKNVFQGNAEQYAGTVLTGSDKAHQTNGFADNVFAGAVPRQFAILEDDGPIYDGPAALAAVMSRLGAYASSVGTVAQAPVVRDAAAHDFTPVPGSPAVNGGVSVFIPWALAKTVGEWHFRELPADRTLVDDDHWSMPAYAVHRFDYWKEPRYALRIQGAEAGDFVDGPAENWCKGALRLDGAKQYLLLKDADMKKPFTYNTTRKMEALGATGAQETATVSGDQLWTPDVGSDSFIVEAHLKVETGGQGLLVGKADAQSGWRLAIDGSGRPGLELVVAGQVAARAQADGAIADGVWHHLLVEVERGATGGIRFWIDGKAAGAGARGAVPAGSLANTGDLLVGGGPGQRYLACTLEFLRIARSSFAESRTTAEELYAWEFDGPQSRDFMGHEPVGVRDAGAIEFVSP